MTRRQIFLIPICIIAALLLLPLVKPFFDSKEIREANKRYREHYESVMDIWRRAAFRDIDQSEGFDKAIAESLARQPDFASLNQRQKSDLILVISHFIHAHGRLDWDTFRRFRLPLSERLTRFEPQLLAQYKRSLPSEEEFKLGMETLSEEANGFAAQGVGVPFFQTDTNWNTFRTYWQLFVQSAFDPDSRRPLYCCWRAVALEDLQLSTSTIREGPKPRALSYQATTNALASSFGLAPSVKYKPSLEELLTKGKTVEALMFSLLVRDNRQSDPYPVHLGLYWNSSRLHWLPFAFELVGKKRSGMKYFF